MVLGPRPKLLIDFFGSQDQRILRAELGSERLLSELCQLLLRKASKTSGTLDVATDLLGWIGAV